MDYNYHTHTARCGHACGSDREYIEVALQHGIKFFGFSDHIPFTFPDGSESYFRIPTSDVEEYVSSLRALGEEYRDHIEIKVGFETEYYPSYFDTMLKNAIQWGADYLIVGQHFIAEEHPNGISCHRPSGRADYLQEYVDCVIAAMQTGVVTYIAHPDLYPFIGDPAIYEEQMRRICRASIQTKTPLELNFLGIRARRNYPDERFWRIAGEEGSPVTFGCDAHDPASAFDESSLQVARNLVKRYHLNYIGKPKLKPLLQAPQALGEEK